MYSYELVIKKGTVEVKRLALNIGKSKKGTYTVLTAPKSRATPFGKLYVEEVEVEAKPKPNKG